MTARTHGHSNPFSPTYHSWVAMKCRCDNRNHVHFKHYGGKGIGYDPRWKKFEAFLDDMGVRPIGTTLDREDGSRDYSKSNCRWATKKEQSRNKVSNVFLTFDGQTKSLIEWAEHLNVSKWALYSRRKYGWSVERTLCEPVGRGRCEQAI